MAEFLHADASPDYQAIRELAVTLTDWRHGYTCDFAGGESAQAAHREEYADMSDQIATALALHGLRIVSVAALPAKTEDEE